MEGLTTPEGTVLISESDGFEVQRLFFGRYNEPNGKFTVLARMSNDYLTNAYIYAIANKQPTELLSKEIDHRFEYGLVVNEDGEYIL